MVEGVIPQLRLKNASSINVVKRAISLLVRARRKPKHTIDTNCTSEPKQKNEDKTCCYNCGKVGHIRWKCPEKAEPEKVVAKSVVLLRGAIAAAEAAMDSRIALLYH